MLTLKAGEEVGCGDGMLLMYAAEGELEGDARTLLTSAVGLDVGEAVAAGADWTLTGDGDTVAAGDAVEDAGADWTPTGEAVGEEPGAADDR